MRLIVKILLSIITISTIAVDGFGQGANMGLPYKLKKAIKNQTINQRIQEQFDTDSLAAPAVGNLPNIIRKPDNMELPAEMPVAIKENKIRYVTGSFRELFPGENLYENVVNNIIWPLDADGSDTSSLLMVVLDNFTPSEIQHMDARLSSGAMIVRKEVKSVDGRPGLWIFLPQMTLSDVTLGHNELGEVVIPGITTGFHRIYTATIEQKGKQDVVITSEPTNVDVYFDGKKVATRTPVVLNDVEYGDHTIRLLSSGELMMKDIPDQLINVSSTNRKFHYNLHKTKDITILAEPAASELQLFKGYQKIASSVGRIEAKDLRYGEYRIVATCMGESEEYSLKVDDYSASTIPVKLVATREVEILALQDGVYVTGANVTIDGEFVGVTPLTYKFPFGEYQIEIFGYGNHKKGKLQVTAATQTRSRYTLKLPTAKPGAHNPFKFGYEKREWGFVFNYVQRSYSVKCKEETLHTDSWGDSGFEDGLQIGLAYQPYFGYGQGLNLGVYYQVFFNNSKLDKESFDQTDSQIYIPLQYQFRMPVTKQMSILINAGLGLGIGCSNKAKVKWTETSDWGYNWEYSDDYDIGYGDNGCTGYNMPKAVQWQMAFGFGWQYKALQLEFKYSKGLTENDVLMRQTFEGIRVESVKADQWSLGLSLMF